jgi:hypothetical protein
VNSCVWSMRETGPSPLAANIHWGNVTIPQPTSDSTAFRHSPHWQMPASHQLAPAQALAGEE